MNTKLIRREVEVLMMTEAGFIAKEVADKLRISTRTVETHRRNINAKLEVRNATAAIRKARALQLLW